MMLQTCIVISNFDDEMFINSEKKEVMLIHAYFYQACLIFQYIYNDYLILTLYCCNTVGFLVKIK